MIKTYANQAAYEAAEKSKIESSVALIESTGRAVFDGVNVVTDNPGVGDILCYDENRKYRFIQLDTFQAGTFPSAWETLGVVVLRKGLVVTVCSKSGDSKKFMEVYPYVVSGYELDGTEHTATLKLHGSETFDFKYTANTDNEFINALKSFLAEHNFTEWSAYIKDGKVYLQYDNYASIERYDETITYATGLSLEEQPLRDNLDMVESSKRYCGTTANWVWNTAKAKKYFMSDLHSTAYNPTADVNREPAYVVCWPAFCGKSQYRDADHCLWLRLKYCKDPDNPTLVEWERYVEACQPILPWMIQMFAPDYREGKHTTERLKGIMYFSADGTKKPLFSAIAFCSQFLDGKGYLPSAYEMTEAFKDDTYAYVDMDIRNADPINRSLYAIGGQTLRGISFLTSTTGKYLSYFPYVLTSYGVLDGSSLYAASFSNTRPFAKIELPLTE